ncbi:MAG: hypothetical protein U0R24_06815 [Solirubrobacterales bacterium]
MHEPVDAPVALDERIAPSLRVVGVHQVHHAHVEPVLRQRELLGDRRHPVGVAIAEGERRALLRELASDLGTEATAHTGDRDDAAVELTHQAGTAVRPSPSARRGRAAKASSSLGPSCV